jgi:hypothetical protein
VPIMPCCCCCCCCDEKQGNSSGSAPANSLLVCMAWNGPPAAASDSWRSGYLLLLAGAAVDACGSMAGTPVSPLMPEAGAASVPQLLLLRAPCA